ncbi:MAG: hypothetical protein RSC77_08775 [Bacteroides sp.]
MKKTKKVCLLLALLAAEVGSMNAQTSVTPDKYKVETNSFSSNWFISVGGVDDMFYNDAALSRAIIVNE